MNVKAYVLQLYGPSPSKLKNDIDTPLKEQVK